jgi:hypothetical protein
MTQAASTLPYNIPELNISEVCSNYTHLRVTVDGFWSDVVSITIHRVGYNYAEPSEWTFNVSHSSGGFVDKFDHLQASINFGLANIAAAEYCRELQQRVDEIEAAFVHNMKTVIALQEEELRILTEKINADPEIGVTIAKATIKKMLDDNADGKIPVVSASYRANPDSKMRIVLFYKNGILRFSVNDHTYTRKNAIETLSSLSLSSMTYSYA